MVPSLFLISAIFTSWYSIWVCSCDVSVNMRLCNRFHKCTYYVVIWPTRGSAILTRKEIEDAKDMGLTICKGIFSKTGRGILLHYYSSEVGSGDGSRLFPFLSSFFMDFFFRLPNYISLNWTVHFGYSRTLTNLKIVNSLISTKNDISVYSTL